MRKRSAPNRCSGCRADGDAIGKTGHVHFHWAGITGLEQGGVQQETNLTWKYGQFMNCRVQQSSAMRVIPERASHIRMPRLISNAFRRAHKPKASCAIALQRHRNCRKAHDALLMHSTSTPPIGNGFRRMGGAQRCPSLFNPTSLMLFPMTVLNFANVATRSMMGIAALHPSYEKRC